MHESRATHTEDVPTLSLFPWISQSLPGSLIQELVQFPFESLSFLHPQHPLQGAPLSTYLFFMNFTQALSDGLGSCEFVVVFPMCTVHPLPHPYLTLSLSLLSLLGRMGPSSDPAGSTGDLHHLQHPLLTPTLCHHLLVKKTQNIHCTSSLLIFFK